MLLRIPFTTSLLHRVAGFECGGEPWEREVAEWIKLPPETGDGALFWAGKGTDSWLYETSNGDLVGYASLGVNPQWSMFHPRTHAKVFRPVQIIPFMGVHKDFHHKPDGARKDLRFAARILSDVMAEAADRCAQGESPVLGLRVHEKNNAAIKFYTRPQFGFQRLGEANAKGYLRMFVDVSDGAKTWI